MPWRMCTRIFDSVTLPLCSAHLACHRAAVGVQPSWYQLAKREWCTWGEGGGVSGAVAYIYARNCRTHLHIHKFSLSAPKATAAAPKNAPCLWQASERERDSCKWNRMPHSLLCVSLCCFCCSFIYRSCSCGIYISVKF